MLPLSPQFRRLLRIFIPKLSNVDLDRHERMVSLRHQLTQERTILENESACGPKPIKNIVKQINEATNVNDQIIVPHKKDFVRVQKLYIKRRQKLVTERKFLQLPTSPNEAWQTVKSNAELNWLQTKMFFLYLPRRIKYILIDSKPSKKITGATATAVVVAGILSLNGIMKSASQPNGRQQVEAKPETQTDVISQETSSDPEAGTVTKTVYYKTTITLPATTEESVVTVSDSIKIEETAAK